MIWRFYSSVLNKNKCQRTVFSFQEPEICGTQHFWKNPSPHFFQYDAITSSIGAVHLPFSIISTYIIGLKSYVLACLCYCSKTQHYYDFKEMGYITWFLSKRLREVNACKFVSCKTHSGFYFKVVIQYIILQQY